MDIIVVDTREFLSDTPMYLAQNNFWIIPMMLTVGDFVLTDKICVERKSVTTSDLFQSLNSGRLL